MDGKLDQTDFVNAVNLLELNLAIATQFMRSFQIMRKQNGKT